ncbi:unnamed protein product, partial [Mesorhabditis belari]|uniref:Galectin domain-containing protein n=1 Tax=Mesorhabditis belari TaxID=2138241 RepID=A0AAF3EXV6_9BILA
MPKMKNGLFSMILMSVLFFSLTSGMTIGSDPISEYTMEIIENMESLLNTGAIIYISGRPNDSISTYEVRLGVDEMTGLRIQYEYVPANGSFPPQDILRFGDDMKQELQKDGKIYAMDRTGTAVTSSLTTENHMIFIRVLDSQYSIYFTNGKSLWNIFNYPFTFPIQNVNSIGLRGGFLLRNYQHWNQSMITPTTFRFPTQDNIFPNGMTVCVVVDSGMGTNFTIDLLGTGTTVNFRWSMDIPNQQYVISNNISGTWTTQGTSVDCGIPEIPFDSNQIMDVVISNTTPALSVFVQIAGFNYTCPSFFVHNPTIDKNVGYHSVVVDGDIQPLHVAMIYTL